MGRMEGPKGGLDVASSDAFSSCGLELLGPALEGCVQYSGIV